VIALLQLRGDRARNFQIHMAFVLGGGVDPDPKWTNWNDDCFGATGPTFCFCISEKVRISPEMKRGTALFESRFHRHH